MAKHSVGRSPDVDMFTTVVAKRHHPPVFKQTAFFPHIIRSLYEAFGVLQPLSYIETTTIPKASGIMTTWPAY
jgi:hypothetical protein